MSIILYLLGVPDKSDGGRYRAATDKSDPRENRMLLCQTGGKTGQTVEQPNVTIPSTSSFTTATFFRANHKQ